MLIPISDSVIKEVLKLQAIEEGRLGNYSEVDGRLDKIRYRVADLVMGSVLKEIRMLQSNPTLGNTQ